MWRGLLISGLVAGAMGCGGMTKQEARKQVGQLVVLYQEDRNKFVLQKQELEQGNCTRAVMLRQAANDQIREQAMSPASNETLTLVQMELAQAEKTCRSR